MKSRIAALGTVLGLLGGTGDAIAIGGGQAPQPLQQALPRSRQGVSVNRFAG